VRRKGWILRNERTITWALVAISVVAVGVAAVVRYGGGHWGSSTSTRTTTTLGLGEALGATAETKGPAFPNGTLHPGALDSRVTQANIRSTICRADWAAKVSPSASFLDDMKRRQLGAEGQTGTAADYAEDHLIPIGLGGDPKDPKNLWPQPWEAKGARLAPAGAGAESKDRVEQKFHDEVCAGSLTLKLARQSIAGNWQLAGAQL
jgi:hypothetical protein